MLPSGPRPGLEEIEPRLLYSADAALLLGGLPVADVRQVASASAAASSQDDSGARWLLVDRRAEDWDRLLAEAQALDPSRPLQLRWVEPDEDGAALRTAVGEGDGAQAALVAAWTDADGRAWLGRSALDAEPRPPVAAALAAAVETGPAEDWTLAVRRELVIIDGRIEGAGALAALWWQDENSTRTLEVIVTDPSRDGLSQIGELLAARGGQEGLAALHLVGHGTAGQFSFGGDAIDAGTLARHEAALRAWGQALAENGDLLLYGCDTGAGSQGEALLEALQALTGADVAASTDATGGSAAGADWDLEATRGAIETTLAAPVHEALMRWEGRLASYVVTDFSDNVFSFFTLRAAIDSANASPGADTITFANGGVPVTILLNAMLPMITDRITIDGSSGGAPTVAIDGSFLGAGADGLQLYTGSDGSTVRGLALQNFSQDGIDISGSGSHVIAGNRIGLDLSGNAAGNQQGVNLWNTSGNRIGGSSAADRNIISGNSGVGIYIGGGSTANRIEGNWIGLDSTGAAAMANPYGILVQSAGNTIGGAGSGAGNIVSGNLDGIVLWGPSASANQILGNRIGLSASGSSAIGNTFDGIRLENGASGNTLGGASAGLRNVISGNGRDGVRITDENSDGNAVLGNWIGSNAAGTAVLGNGGDGIFIRNGADSSRIGGAAPGEGNWVIGAGLVGIEIDGDSTGTTIRGNRVGTDLAGTANLGAQQNGILLENGAAQTSIVENTVAFSGQGGVYTAGIDLAWSAGSSNLISRNTLYSNVGQDINLGASGLDGNDSLDADSGANDLQNRPLLTRATLGAGTLQVIGQLDSAASALYRIEFFADPGGQGDARVYLGQTTVTSDAGGRASIDALLEASLVAGTTVTATATRVSSGSTSEAAVPVTVAARANTAPGFVAASGQVITPVSGGDDWIRAMQIQDDGRILVAGHQPGAGGGQDVLLMRYRADGTLDTTFGSGGRVTVAAASFGGTTAQVWAMAVQADGAIVLAGQTTVGGVQYALVQRYLADGSLDIRFSGDGTALWGDVSQFCEASAVAIDAQGRIVLGGTVSGATAVARVTVDGMLDASFGGGNGYAWVDAGLGADLVGALAIQSDGRILLGGSAGNDHALVRWNDDGTLDAGFGSGGIVRTDVAGGFDMIRALVVQDDGRILAGGYSTQAGGDIDFTLLRYLASGSVDTGFSGDGRVTTDLGGADIVQAMVRDASGRIVLAGYDGSGRIALVRHLADGSLDTAFGQGGLVQQAIGASSGAGALALRPDGRLVAAGWSSDGTQRDPLLLGLLTDGSLDPGVGSAAATLGGTVAWTEDSAAVVLDADVRLNDADLAQAGSYAGATLTLARQGGAQAQDQLAFDGLVVTVSGSAVLVDGVQVGSYTFTGGQMQVSFGAQATQDRVDRLARHIVYWNSSDSPPASVTIVWTLADGNTGAQGSGGALAGAGSVTVAITAVNDAPSGSPATIAVTDTTPRTFSAADFGYSDPEGDALHSVTITTLPGRGVLMLDGQKVAAGQAIAAADLARLTWLPTGLVGSASTAFTFQVRDGGGALDATPDTLTLQITAVNDAPLLALGAGNLVQDGSFENGGAAWSGNVGLEVLGTDRLAEFQVAAPPEGSHFAEIEGFGLNGSTPSWIEQTIATTAGQRYVFSLAAATRNQYNIDDIGALSVDGVELLRFTASDDWRRHAVSFVASGATATIRISSLGSITGFTAPGDSIGLLVDDVRVSTVAGSAAWTEGAAPVVLAPEALPVDAELDAQADWSGATLVLARQGGADASDVFGASGTLGVLNTGGALQLGGITVGSVVANSGGQLSLAFAGGISADSVRDVLRQITWASSSDAPPAAVTLDWLLSDGSATASASSVVAVSAVNDAPTLALPGRQSTPVDTPLVLDSASGRAPQVADADAALLQVTLTSDGHGLLTLSGTTGLSFSAGDGSADTAMTFSGSAAAINAALDGLRFVPSAAYQGSATIGFSVSDLGGSGSGGTLTTTGSVIVEVGALRFRDGSAGYAGTKDTYIDDSAPGSAFGTSTTVRADDGSPRQTALIRFDQIIGNGAGQIPAGAIITSATLSLYVTERDLADTVVLHRMRIDWSESSTHASLVNGIQADGSDAEASGITIDAGLSGWINISGLAAAVQAWVDGAPNFGWAIVSDAADTWAFASSESVDLALRPYLTVAYTVPQTPVLGTSAGGASYVENAAPVAVDPALTLSDADSTQLSGASVVISAGHVAAQDVLSWAAVTGISGSWNAATGTLSFSGTAALADYRTLLRSVSYANSSDSPSGASRTLSFTVTDTTGLSSAAATRSIQLSAVNDAPTVASPIADQSATEDQSFSFQLPAGTFADVDAGDSLSYTTSTLPSWLSFDAATRTFSGTPANADVGSLTITVTAKDGSNAAASDSFVLTVTNVNDAPTVASPIADQSATEDQPFSFQLPAGTFADVDAGDSLSYTTSTLPSWLSFDAATRTFSGTPANADVGSLTITVTAKDGSNAAASDSFVLTVTNVNDAPTVASPIADQSATEDQPFSFQLPAGTFADVDAGDSLSYTTSTLPSWLSFDAATRTFSGTPANADVGTLTITVTAKDGSNAAASDSFVLTVTNVNDAPTVATPIADQSATEDQPFSFQIPSGTFADVDAGDSLSYTTSTLPSWLSFNTATRTFSGTPANADVGSLTITVTAKDGSNATASDSFVLTVENVNDTPTVATPIADQSATEDQPFSFQIPSGTFADVDAGDSLSYTTSTLPSWLSFNAATRTFSGTPANADVGSLTITVTAKDGSNATASDSFVLTVTNVNDAPTVATPIADQSATEDQSFSFQLPAGTFADVDAGDSLTYTTSALPSWLSFNTATRTFSGTPANADVGTLTITVTAKDGSNAAASDSFVLTVTNVNDAPTVATPIADQDATEDQPFSFQIPAGTFADVDAGDSLSYTTSALPSWLSFNAATRTFSGTPANADVGSLTITVTAKDGSNAAASDSFVLTVTNVNDVPTVASPITDQSATEDQPFSFQLPAGTFADVDAGDSLSYTTSTLPSWLSFNAATRTFSGTPANADVGSLTITVTAKDGSNAAASDSFVLTIANVNDAPTVASPIADQSATEDQSFSFQLPAGTFADVDAGDSLSYTTSALPGWLSFNAATRTFSGTPANADVGSLTITVTAKDGSNAAASDSFVLTIANVNDAPTVATPIADQSATEDQPFSFQIPSGTFADVDAGDSLSYTTSTLPSWLSFNAATRTFSGTPANADVGSLTITVTAKDGSNATASDAFVLTVTNVNDAPTVATPIADQSATEDQSFSFQLPAGTFADVDAGDSLSYTTSTLPSWLSFDAATRTFSGTPANADVGTLTITVTAKDGSNAAASDSFVLTVTNVNDAPTVATSIADQDATEDQPFSFQIPAGTFADVDAGDSLSYTTSTLPSWLSFNAATRTFSGTPANADVGSLTITVTAKDGSNATASDSFVLTVTNVNDAPTVATPIADQSATEDQPFSFQIPAGTFADVDAGDSLSYTTSTLPSWLSFNAATRTFSGTPANADVGTLTITVTAKDGSNAAASDSFVLTVTNVNDAPTVASPITDQSATEDQPFSFQIPAGTFADVDAGDSLSYTTSTLPSWLSFNAATRTFSGTPANADVGSLTITVTAKDGSNAAASDSFVLTVENVNDAPILQAGGPLTLEEGGHQVLTLADLLPADVDDDERSLVFERVGGAPAGRLERVDAPGVAVDRFSAGDLADGLIRYVHDGSESVSDRLELRVRDASGAFSDPVRLEIVITPVDDEAPRIVSSDGQARVVLDHSENSPWQRVMQASDADRPLSVLQWRIAGGADAARFEIDADSGELRLLGLLDREQPQDADRDNHYEVLIEVSDGRQAATQQLLLRITDVDEAPEIEIGLLQVDQGMRLRLDESLLRAQDVDSAADVLVYRVVAVENGRFVETGSTSVLTTFSQADVAAGRVVFQHDENSLAARFSLVLSDGRNESGVMSIEIAVRERGFDAGSMPTEPPPDRMPASSSLVVSGLEPADPMRERTQQAQASQEIVRAAVLRGLAAREGGGAGAAELVAGDLMAGWVDALRRFATLSASETQAARPGALRGEVGFSVDLMRLPDSDLLVLLDVVLDLAGFEATALIRPVSEGVGGTQTASGETARSAGTDEPENLLQREWQSGTVARTGAVVMSAGALFWAVRAGGLAASLAFASPVWWRLDPLPVLQAARRETAGAEAGRRGWRDTGVTGELAGLAEDLLDRQG